MPVDETNMNDEVFQEALTEVMKKMEDANKCYSFNLVRVIEATKQIVAGIKFVMKLEVTPVYSGENDDECSSQCESGLVGNKEAVVSVVLHPWRETKYDIKFNPHSDYTTDFHDDGELNLNCKISDWIPLSREELQRGEFRKAVQSAIDKLNRDVGKCFKYKLLEVLSGKKKRTPRMEFAWDMKVEKNHQESGADCLGSCTVNCSEVLVYAATAIASSLEIRDPQLLQVELKELFIL